MSLYAQGGSHQRYDLLEQQRREGGQPMWFMGIDVAKASLEVCLLGDPQTWQATFSNDAAGWGKLSHWLDKRLKGQAVHVCLEATGRYSEGVVAYLFEQGYPVSVVNPARIKGYATSRLSRNKTDRLDAALIADFCRVHQPDLPLWQPPDPAQRHLQDLVRQLDDLEGMRQQERNRLHAAAIGHTAPSVIQRLRDHLAFLDAQIAALKQELRDQIDQHPDLRRMTELLTSIPGLGWLTVAKLLALIPNLATFDSPRQLVAFAGLNPQQRQSGSSIRGKTAISRIGHAAIRAALFMPAVVAKNHNLLLQPFVQRLAERGLCPLSMVVAVMRKLLHLIFGILKSGQPFDPHYLDKQAVVT